jgi:large subunit ribosomal protein L6
MSRIGKQPIDIPEKVTVAVQNGKVTVQGPLGNLNFNLPEAIEVSQKEKKLFVEVKKEKFSAIHGTVRAALKNLIEGVSKGFTKTLEIKGLGYRVQVAGSKLNLELGFSHPVIFDMPAGISAEFDGKKSLLTIKGADKVTVGDVAARIRKMRPPEPYKGAGIRYLNERVTRKAGKTAAVGAKK